MEAARKAVSMAARADVQAEAYVLHSDELTIEVRDGRVETLKKAEEIGLGLRVIQSARQGFSYTTDLKPESIRETIARALDAARYTSADQHNVLPEPGGNYPVLATFDEAIEKMDLDTKVEMARQIELAARQHDRRVKIIESSGYEDSRHSVAVVNSKGLEAFQKGSFAGIYISLMAEENGEVQTGFAFEARRALGDIDPKRVGEEGAYNAVRLLGARSAPSQALPCIMEPYVMTSFLSVLSGSLCADAVQKGKSALAGKIGAVIANQLVSLVDDGTYANGIASFPFDGEGHPSEKTLLINEGRLNGFLYDAYTAHKDGVTSTGNGVRGSFRGLPGVGTTNFFLMAGSKSPQNLREGLDRGLYVTEVMGMHTANPISGDFSVGASGIMIENGQLTFPVRGITIAGNLYSFLQDIDGVADDLRFYGGMGSPTVRVKSLSIAGE